MNCCLEFRTWWYIKNIVIVLKPYYWSIHLSSEILSVLLIFCVELISFLHLTKLGAIFNYIVLLVEVVHWLKAIFLIKEKGKITTLFKMLVHNIFSFFRSPWFSLTQTSPIEWLRKHDEQLPWTTFLYQRSRSNHCDKLSWA